MDAAAVELSKMSADVRSGLIMVAVVGRSRQYGESAMIEGDVPTADADR